MRVVVAGILLSSLVLAACGTNQTGQTNKEQPLVKQDKPVDLQEQSATDTASGIVMPESNLNASTETSDTKSVDSEIVMEGTSDNSMIKDSGIQTEIKQEAEEKSAIAMEDMKKEIVEQKDEIKKQVVEPKS